MPSCLSKRVVVMLPLTSFSSKISKYEIDDSDSNESGKV